MNVQAADLTRRHGHTGPQLDILTEERCLSALDVACGSEQHHDVTSLEAQVGRWLEPTISVADECRGDDAGQRQLAKCTPDRWGAERQQHRMQPVARAQVRVVKKAAVAADELTQQLIAISPLLLDASQGDVLVSP